ncbi:hypothetical protein DSO57_1025416 [Entomophthora muscae]|uniref:Uncharacterized protein n=1 Tax=Entomophthora muscae TaxID=34485 RepID=A0ACC2SEY4_9FUNG|nr:hypothetical protein DSO57_1025416 [Entomophthora muscae]
MSAMWHLFLIVSALSLARGHMELKKPLCRRSRFDKNLMWNQIDYSNMFPLGDNTKIDFPFPCRGLPVGNITDTLTAGTKFVSQLAGDITHNGGHCEWSISYDGSTFVTIHTIIGECVTHGVRQYLINLPDTAPPGQAVLAWTWVNRTGLREFYMNCADVMVVNTGTPGTIQGPAPVIANLPGFPIIPQFTNGILGQELYENRPIITIGKLTEATPALNIPPPNSNHSCHTPHSHAKPLSDHAINGSPISNDSKQMKLKYTFILLNTIQTIYLLKSRQDL